MILVKKVTLLPKGTSSSNQELTFIRLRQLLRDKINRLIANYCNIHEYSIVFCSR